MLSKPGLDIKSLADILSVRYPHLRPQIAKAARLIERRRIWLDADNPILPAYLCLSSDGQQTYTVMPGTCTCPARGVCYHRIARRLCELHDALCQKVAQAPKPPSIRKSQRALEVHLKRQARAIPEGVTLH